MLYLDADTRHGGFHQKALLEHQSLEPWAPNQRFVPLIENEAYLQSCGNYIEGNPVQAGIVTRCEDWPHSSSRYYNHRIEDSLIDPYMFDGEPIKIKEDQKEAFFTKGYAIGSELFKIHVEEEITRGLPVPR